MQANTLKGIRVLVTRPEHQSQLLCDLIAEQGGQAVKFPVLKIAALHLSELSADLIEHVYKFDYAVFISPNAVEYGLAQILAHGKIPDTLKLVTVGKASAQKMHQIIGRMPDIYPMKQYNSESLLMLNSLQRGAVNNKNILIVRGRGGRELLASTLRQRGAEVNYAEVYQRIMPKVSQKTLDSIWGGADAPDIVTVTSNEGLMNLSAMVGQSYKMQLMQIPIVVVTEKMRLKARVLGFKNVIIVAAQASNEALLESVLEWVKTNNYTMSQIEK